MYVTASVISICDMLHSVTALFFESEAQGDRSEKWIGGWRVGGTVGVGEGQGKGKGDRERGVRVRERGVKGERKREE